MLPVLWLLLLSSCVIIVVCRHHCQPKLLPCFSFVVMCLSVHRVVFVDIVQSPTRTKFVHRTTQTRQARTQINANLPLDCLSPCEQTPQRRMKSSYRELFNMTKHRSRPRRHRPIDPSIHRRLPVSLSTEAFTMPSLCRHVFVGTPCCFRRHCTVTD